MLTLGHNNDTGGPVGLSPRSLLRHSLVLGGSGSGKTYLCKVMVEEAVKAGIPVIILDPQGDLASLGVVDKAGPYFDKIDLCIWTPGSSLGNQLSLCPVFDVPAGISEEDRIRAFGGLATSIASITGQTSQEAVSAFCQILEWADENGYWIENLTDFRDWLEVMPAPLERKICTLLSNKMRELAIKRLDAISMGPDRMLFQGSPINIATMLGHDDTREPGRTRVSVVYLNTLQDQEDKEHFVGVMAGALYQYMLRNPTPGTLQGILYIDEFAAYLPPLNVKKPASKDPLMLLLRQARKYGFGLQLATQSPGDLDYKGLDQIGTCIFGRLQSEQALAKIEPLVQSMQGMDGDKIMATIPGLECGQFLLASPDNYQGAVNFRGRKIESKHYIVPAQDIPSLIE